MKVKLLTGRAGDKFSQSPGDIIEISDAEGNRLIDAGQAEKATQPSAKTKPGKTKE